MEKSRTNHERENAGEDNLYMTDFTAFDGSQFKTKRAKEKFERKALLRLFKENNNTCPWVSSCAGSRNVTCYGYIEDMENCFGLRLLEEPAERIVFS